MISVYINKVNNKLNSRWNMYTGTQQGITKDSDYESINAYITEEFAGGDEDAITVDQFNELFSIADSEP